MRLRTTQGSAGMLDRDEKAETRRGRRHPPALPRRAQDDRVPQAAQADHPRHARGDRALRHGRTPRPDAPREKWLVCLSGGKDSYTLLAALTELQWRGLLPVDILACNLDQGQPGFPATVLPEFLTGWACRTGSNTPTPIPSWSTRCRRGGPIARSARGSGAATSTASRARKGAARWCWAITATTSSRRSS
jgi:hypothetical protein